MVERNAFTTKDQASIPPDTQNLIRECGTLAALSDKYCYKNSEVLLTEHAPNPDDNLPILEITDQSNPPELGAGDYLEPIVVDGKPREFELHVPQGYDGKSPIPIMYMFHGFTENMNMMREYSQMSALADEKGFAVAYMQADKLPLPSSMGVWQERSWNLDHGTLTAKDPTYDDLDYVEQVKSVIESEINVDKSREYLVGFSEGGQAVSYIAQQMPNNFAGIASVHGTMIDSDPRPTTDGATPFLSILGNDDAILPLSGGAGPILYPVITAWSSKPTAQAEAWADANGNSESQFTTQVGDSIITSYTGGSAPVEQIVRLKHDGPNGIQGGSHAWDGGNNGEKGEPYPDFFQWSSRLLRHSDPDFNASQAVADFLLPNVLLDYEN